MSKAERLKEEIGWLKVAFAIAVALDASLVVWLAQNHADAGVVLTTSGLVAALVIAVIVTVRNRRAYQRLDELEKL